MMARNRISFSLTPGVRTLHHIHPRPVMLQKIHIHRGEAIDRAQLVMLDLGAAVALVRAAL